MKVKQKRLKRARSTITVKINLNGVVLGLLLIEDDVDRKTLLFIYLGYALKRKYVTFAILSLPGSFYLAMPFAILS